MKQALTIEALEREKCTGCGACDNICPVDAIIMEREPSGFSYPHIQPEVCIHCGKCYKACPALHPLRPHPVPACYAAMGEDSLRAQSSSGGLFTLLAESILSQGGFVCGAVWEPGWQVRHIVTNRPEDLAAIRLSKYLQSEIGNTFSQVKTLLEQGRPVLFTGCPCQVAGLYGFLGKSYDRLLTMDIVCHGVPSPGLFPVYLQERAGGKKVTGVNFREKTRYGWSTPITITFEDGSVYRNDCYQDAWYQGFLQGVLTRDCCAKCPYAQIRRVSDLTGGDFWGVDQFDPHLNDRKGTSLILANTAKGEEALRAIQHRWKQFQAVPVETVTEIAKKRNGQLLSPMRAFPGRKRFWELLESRPFSKAMQQTLHHQYDVGVVGWWYNENYGGALTYYALHQTLKQMGLSVLMIEKPSESPEYRPNTSTIPRRFAAKYYHVSKNYHPNTMGELNRYCSAFLSGSDQLFSPWLWEYSGPPYYLDFAAPNKTIVSYASSFGNDYAASPQYSLRVGYWLRRFDAISVREDYGVEILQNHFGIRGAHVADPVFLCGVEEYEKLIQNSHAEKKEPYVLSFLLDPDSHKREAVQRMAAQFDKPALNLLHAMDFEENRKKLDLPNTKTDLDIEDWLFYYRNADFILTDSFHGTCFAIIFKKPFISIANTRRGDKRFVSLLKELGLLERLVYDPARIGQDKTLFQDIDYEKVYRILDEKAAFSREWLRQALLAPKPKASDLFRTVDGKINETTQKILRLQKLIYEQGQQLERLNRLLEKKEGNP